MIRGEGLGRKVFLDPEAKDFKRGSSRESSGKERNKRRMTSASMNADGGQSFRRQRLERKAARLKDEDLAAASLLIMGQDNPLLRRLGIEPPPFDTGFGLVVMKNPRNPRKVVAVASGKSRAEIDLAQGQITDYRKYSTADLRPGQACQQNIGKSG
ncbi:MAG: hypothetical protein MZV70_55095 [Desulfobacterales bacterium]|nr:hypothetical protein [Desulfobacterales bacterium]